MNDSVIDMRDLRYSFLVCVGMFLREYVMSTFFTSMMSHRMKTQNEQIQAYPENSTATNPIEDIVEYIIQ